MSNFTAHTGTPQFLQGNVAPHGDEAVNVEAFNSGTLIFYWDRSTDIIWWLQFINPETTVQTWQAYPETVQDTAYIGIAPVLNKLYWMVSPTDNPTTTEPFPSQFYDGTYCIVWWNQALGSFFKMTDYDANQQTQVWTQMI